ncbi:MAG: DUF5683 domain-containing protein [Chitinophagales bacterium]|nr:hypothetical protein [Bacteroidota bacterium]MCB9042499.1 hypothetical protein [Chitinophagales bacterium]
MRSFFLCGFLCVFWINLHACPFAPDSLLVQADTTLVVSDTTNTVVQDSIAPPQKYWRLGIIDSLPIPLQKPYQAAIASALLPGLGQINNGQMPKGIAYFGGVASLSTAGFILRKDYKNYNTAYNQRLAGVFDDPFFHLSDEALRLKMQKTQKQYKTAFTFASILYGINVLDAFIFKSMQVAYPPKSHSPYLAAFKSTVLPGWGQVYNKKYWKIPIIYAGLGTSIYYIYTNADIQQAFKEAYEQRDNADFVPDPRVAGYNDETLLRGRQIYLRNTEVAVLVTAAIYVLNILDATVDAHLYDFDVDDAISQRFQWQFAPENIVYNNKQTLSWQLRCSWQF